MLDSTVKQQINNARDILVGKIPDPKGQIDQITNALIYKFMDDQDRLALTLPGGKETFFVNELKPYAWHKLFDSKLSNQEKADLYIEGVHKLSKAKHLPELFKDIFKDAFLPFRAPDTISMFLGEINKFDYKHSENLGNAFEYLLSFLSVQGDLGSFRTPRNIIEFIVDAVAPQKEDTILDPACGTAGFLIEAYKHITQNKNLAPNEIQSLAQNIYGIEIDPGMAKIARVNLYLHGFKTPHIIEDDTLSNDNLWGKKYDVILANPPFMSPKGGIVPHDKFGVESKRAEVLFTDYIAEHLKLGGRAGIVVPEGVIFQSGAAYKQLRRMLIEDNYLWAVISLPAGVFNPYSGVKTSILLFDRARAEKNTEVLFFQVDNDGYGLGAQRREIKENDLPEALEAVNKWKKNKKILSEKVLYIEKDKIRETEEYKLSIDNYKEAVDYSNAKWPMVELGEVLEFIGKGSRPASFASTEGRIPFFVSSEKKKTCDLADYNMEALVIGDGGSANVHYVNGEFSSSDHTYLLKSKDKKSVSLVYIYYLLKNNLHLIESGFNGQGLKNVSKKYLKSIQLPLPPLDIQNKKVEEIDRYQGIIDGAEKIINNWKPSFDIDPEWEKVELGSICSKLTDGSHFSPETKDQGVPYVTVKDIDRDGKINLLSSKKISTDDYLLLSKNGCKPKKGDILFSKDGTVGKVSLIDFDDDFVVLSSLAIISLLEKRALPKFIYYVLQAPEIISSILNMMKGVAIRRVIIKDLKSVIIPLPNIELQKSIIANIEKEKELINGTKHLLSINKEKIKRIIDKTWSM